LLIKPLADIRNISVLEMAELILEKAAIANQKIIQAEAIEDQYQDLIESAETVSKLAELLNEVSIQMENF
jgi:sugar diacid utilization regulator